MGYCNLNCTADCYGCVYYGTGDIQGCKLTIAFHKKHPNHTDEEYKEYMLKYRKENHNTKEMDLDYIKDELDRVVKIYKPDGNFGWGTLYNIATHFFELGLKAKIE